MATRSENTLSADGANCCPICLDAFIMPRQLKCMHAFCEKCLDDYLSTIAGDKGGTVNEFMCPICRTVSILHKRGKPVGEWASLFPRSAISITAEVKVERYCDTCRYEDEFNKADGFCAVCKENLCEACSKVHRRSKLTRDHNLIIIEELTSTTENRMKFAEGFGCTDHQEKQIEYYCQIHDVVSCNDCFFVNHRSCENVKRLSVDLPCLMTELKPEKITEKMKKMEKHIQTFLNRNESNISELEAKVNNLTTEIEDIRQVINTKLDDLETLVKTEGNRIYKEEMIKRQEENHQCQSLINAVRNSHTFLETVLKYGTDAQKILVCKKSIAQIKSYSHQIREKYEEMGPLHELQVKLDKVVEIHSTGKYKPMYTGIVQLANACILLLDENNKTCSLYDSSYNFVNSCILPATPNDVCLMDHSEVAIAFHNKNSIQFLSIGDGCIKDTGMVTTRYRCGSVAAVSRDEIVVCGPTDDLKCYWSRINRSRSETHHAFDCSNPMITYVTLNNALNRVYVSALFSSEVFCFCITNETQDFIYTSKDLICPAGIEVDREENIYIVGCGSHNIHKLSPDGTNLQIITAGVPNCPTRISLDRSGDYLLVTNSSLHQYTNIYMFALK
ncbi:hypothetical protein CHS0354_010715 [Potamilus streckersoni]|uniref:Uncharacterized protein n=1 Tax=Potamilus streckersoni TaxID=2493646 RepID=A0AAE0SQC0_9BIVA|nr:hypothetical protein CHS0354_010715 [Potamilus streckersoni]